MTFPFHWGERCIDSHEGLVEALGHRARAGLLDHPGQLHPAQGVWALMRSTPGLAEPIKAAAQTLLEESNDPDVLEFVLHLWQRPWTSAGFHRTLLTRLTAGEFSAVAPGSHGTLLDDAVDRLADSAVIDDPSMREEALVIAIAHRAWSVALVLLRLSGQFLRLVEVLGSMPDGGLGPADAALIATDLAEKAPELLPAAAAAIRGEEEGTRQAFVREAAGAAPWMNDEDVALLRSALELE